MQSVPSFELVTAAGISGEPRYFGRTRGSDRGPTDRQVSLIEREQISEHAAALGLLTIPPGAVRSNIETLGLNLIDLIGQNVQVGEAVVQFYAPRTPCQKMDDVAPGLRTLMENSSQGVLARILKSGVVRVDDPIRLFPPLPRAADPDPDSG
jgi:MOSC domain-containing protein YiiM